MNIITRANHFRSQFVTFRNKDFEEFSKIMDGFGQQGFRLVSHTTVLAGQFVWDTAIMVREYNKRRKVVLDENPNP